MITITGLLLLAFAIILLYIVLKRTKVINAVCRKKCDDTDLHVYRKMNTDGASSIEHTTGCDIKNKHYIHTRTKKEKSFLSFLRKYENLPLQQSLDAAEQYQQKSDKPCEHNNA